MASKESDVLAAIRRLKESRVPQHNRELILEWDKKLSGNLVGFARRKKFIDVLRWWALELRMDFEKAQDSSLRKAYEELKATRYAPATKNRYISMLRQFYKHLEGEDDFFPPKVRKLKQLPHHQEMISEDGETSIRIFSIKELLAMINAAKTPRDKAIIAATYDGAGRREEARVVTRKQVKRKPPYIMMFFHGDKTKRYGRVGQRWNPLYFAVPYIEDYLKTSPFKDGNEDGPFWVNDGKTRASKDGWMSDTAFSTVFYRAMKNAGISGRRIHDLRHTKYTHFKRLGGKDGQGKKLMGWSPNSSQPGRYEHLIGEDTVEEVSRIYGIQYKRADNDDIPIPVRCLKCQAVNSEGSDFCSTCNSPISAKAIVNAETREKYVRKKFKEENDKLAEEIREMHKRILRLETQKWEETSGKGQPKEIKK